MVWKQDLAKLKQQFKDVGETKPKSPVPKPVPRPEAPASMDEEDALFLSAMGKRAAPSVPRKETMPPPAEAGPAVALPPPPPPEDFQAAMGDLKGLKPLAPRIPAGRSKEKPVPLPVEPEVRTAVPATEPPAAELPAPSAELPAVPGAPGRAGATLIHLAAGMAIEVDGSLDLRGHTTADALERLRERVQDGVFLGWRTFQVILGPSEDLRHAFLAFLGEPGARVIARYAQAPIPMGGNQAWILYYVSPAVH